MASAPAPAGEPTQCLQAGSFDERQTMVLRQAGGGAARRQLAAGGHRRTRALDGLHGPLCRCRSGREKRAELRALGVSYDRPGAAWEHGLSLGRFSSEERAQAALKDLARQGIRTARVVQERTESKVLYPAPACGTVRCKDTFILP